MSIEDAHARQDGEEPHIRLQILGGFRAEQHGITVPDSAWDRPKAKILVKLLAVEPSHQLHREQILDILWPDLSPESALTSFRKTLHRARHALEPQLPSRSATSCLQLSGDTLSFQPGRVEVDADRFERLARTALASEDPDAYRVALCAYGGDVLPEDRYENWAVARRESLMDLYARLLQRFATILERQQEPERAVRPLEELLRRDPLREDVSRQLMRLHAALGNRRQALHHYELCRQSLQDELGVEPEPETTDLREEIASGNLSSALSPKQRQLAPLPSAVRRLPRHEFVGRDRPLQLLASNLARMRQRVRTTAHIAHFPVVLIGGEAGVGKTRLAAEVARRAHEDGMLVLWGETYQEDAHMPYLPIIEALGGYLETRSPAERERLGATYPELLPMLPGLAQPRQTTHEIPEHDHDEAGRYRLFNATVRLLSELAQAQPLVLVLDDLHLADAATLQLLQHLARVRHNHRWCVLATYRTEDVESGGPFDLLRLSLARSSLAQHLDLLRLSRADCATLLAELLPEGAVGDAVVDRLYALSLGNPFFTTELVQAMRGDALVLHDGEWRFVAESVEIPARITDLIASRICRLPDVTRQVLMLAATAGMESRYDILRAASSLEDAVLLDALDAALDACILDERDDSFVFHHPLLRETLYERLSRARRVHLHRRLAEAFRALHPDAVEAIAHHYEAADAPEAAEWLERAGDRAASVYASDAAIAFFEAARKRLSQDDLPGQARLQEKTGSSLKVAGQYEAAIAALNECARIARHLGDLETLGRVTARIGRAHRWRGTPDEGIALVRRMIDVLSPQGSSPALVALHLSLAHLLNMSGRYLELLDVSRRAVEIAEAVRERGMAAEARALQGAALISTMQAAEARAILEEAVAELEATGNRELLWQALYSSAWAAQGVLDLESERRCFERALRLAEEVGNQDRVVLTLAGLGNTLTLLGHFDEARTCLERGVCLARAAGGGPGLAEISIRRAHLALWEGDLQTAESLLHAALTIGKNVGDRMLQEHAQCHLAELDLLLDRPADALARLEPLTQGETVGSNILTRVARARILTGDGERAEAAARQAVEQERPGTQFQLPEALEFLGIVQFRRGDLEQAEKHLMEALELARSTPLPYYHARILYEMAHVSLARKDNEGARQRLECALEIFRRLGARLNMERTEAALQECARSPR